MRRLLFGLLLLCMAATLGGWHVGAGSLTADDAKADATATIGGSATEAGTGVSEPAGPDLRPCMVRADCAGGGLLVGPPLLLIVALPVLFALALISLGRASTSVAALNPAVLTVRLDRPPQLPS